VKQGAGLQPCVHRLLSLVLSIAAVLSSRPARAAQRDVEAAALSACSRELQSRLGRENGGRHPRAIVDPSDADVRLPSSDQAFVRGQGRYSPNESDRGRAFDFECVYDLRRDNVTRLEYRWADGDDGRVRPAYPPPPGLEYGGGDARPRGDVIFSGGIVNRMSHKALDVQDRSTRSGATVQQWSYGGQPNQRWNVIELGRGEFAIVSVGTGRVLEVAGGDLRNGGRVEQNRWVGSPSQRWRIDKKGDFNEVMNVASGRCLDVTDKSPADGASIQQRDCSGAANQAWRFQK
jgi:ricin-type beta-trefoil lectin protein